MVDAPGALDLACLLTTAPCGTLGVLSINQALLIRLLFLRLPLYPTATFVGPFFGALTQTHHSCPNPLHYYRFLPPEGLDCRQLANNLRYRDEYLVL